MRSVALEMALEQRAIGRRIAELRQAARLTQEVAAQQLGVSLRGYQGWEAGETRPRWDNLDRLATLFGVRIEDVIGATSEPADGTPTPFEQRSVERRLERIEAKLDQLIAAQAERSTRAADVAAALPQLPAAEPTRSAARKTR